MIVIVKQAWKEFNHDVRINKLQEASVGIKSVSRCFISTRRGEERRGDNPSIQLPALFPKWITGEGNYIGGIFDLSHVSQNDPAVTRVLTPM